MSATNQMHYLPGLASHWIWEYRIDVESMLHAEEQRQKNI